MTLGVNVEALALVDAGVSRKHRVKLAQIPKLILGSMNFGDVIDKTEAETIMLRAYELGIKEIDTANTYSQGRSEKIVGDVVKRHNLDVKVATKVGMPTGRDTKLLSEEVINAEIEKSLQRMEMTAIERLYLHQPDRTVSIRETLSAVRGLLEQGTIKALGLSNYASWQSLEVLNICSEWSCAIDVHGQQLYNLLARRIEDEYLEFAESYRVPTVVYNPLAGGLLTEKAVAIGLDSLSRYGSSRLASIYKDRYGNAETYAVLHQLNELARDNWMSLTELSFRWLTSKPQVDGILIGASSAEQLRKSFDYISQGALPEGVAEDCERITDRLKGGMPNYNR